MAIKFLEYTVDIGGVTPSTVQFGGTQGDHRVTQLDICVNDGLYDAITDTYPNSKIMYRYDVYDGGGGLWQSDVAELSTPNLSIELEERHTRFGGKVVVYLVISGLSEDNETETELYSFPIVLQLKSRPEGELQQGENYESVTSLASAAKKAAQDAAIANAQAEELAAEVEQKLANGEFDGVGVSSAEIISDELIITYTNGVTQNLGNVKGDTGPQGEKGEKGDNGEDALIDQGYSPTSENAQSGIAVAEAISTCVPKNNGTGWDCVYGVNGGYTQTIFEVEDISAFPNGRYGDIARRQANGNLQTNTPVNEIDCANKKYVDDKLGDIETLLGGI